MNFENLKSLAGDCSCGERHTLSVKEILLRDGAIKKICDIIKGLLLCGEALLVCDDNTYKAAGILVEDELKKGDIKYRTVMINAVGKSPRHHFVMPNRRNATISPSGKGGEGGRENPAPTIADENAVKFVTDNLKDAGFIIAAGSGTVTDICRYVSFNSGVPFISVPTAPSMDGYLSTVAAMTFGGCKVTKPAVSPVAVIADTDILCKAPQNLILAGVGDILGKFTCLADWEISSLVTKEVFCKRTADLTREAIEKVVSSLEAIKKGEKQGIENLMYALLMSGISMQLTGSSRPASGAEHHLSHFWEMYLLREQPPLPEGKIVAGDDSGPQSGGGIFTHPLHGEKVGVATVLIAKIYERLKLIEDISNHIVPYNKITKKELDFAFGGNVKEIIKENIPDILLSVNEKKLMGNWQKIREVLNKIPDSKEIEDMLIYCGAKRLPSELGIDKKVVAYGLLYCPYVRNRLTLLRMLKILKL